MKRIFGQKTKNRKMFICGSLLQKKAADLSGVRGFQFLCLTIMETEQQTPPVR